MTIRENKTRRGRGGFTLVEMLLVVAILGILAAIVIPNVVGKSEKARLTAANAQINSFSTALNMFEVDNGFFPRGKDGLTALVQKPRDATKWSGPYIDSIPKDPWGNPYVYECPGKHNPNKYDLSAKSPDGTLVANWDTAK